MAGAENGFGFTENSGKPGKPGGRVSRAVTSPGFTVTFDLVPKTAHLIVERLKAGRNAGCTLDQAKLRLYKRSKLDAEAGTLNGSYRLMIHSRSPMKKPPEIALGGQFVILYF